jgi:UDP-4-amino-4,6-dideoxy-N-acetyl-beta-L-altrosamine transaminase
MKHKYIPYGHQNIDEEDIKAVVEVLKSDFLTTGPKVTEFEQKISEYIGCKYAVAVSSGTAALHAACFAAGIKERDEVITTPMTFAATSNCILYMGGKPVFVDIDKDTYNIDTSKIEKKITDKTKAIIAVDFTGQPAELFKIKKLAEKYNLFFIEDAAHSLGAEIKDEHGSWHRVGSEAHMTTFSFHPVKHITTAEGGMICTDDYDLYNRLKLFRTHGITRDEELLMNKNNGKWYYEQQCLGYNYRLSDLQAALGISQLKRLDKFIERRRHIAEVYNKAFSEGEFQDKITIPYQSENTKSSYHIYVVKLNLASIRISRNEIFNKLLELNIGVNLHYIPVYYHPYYKALGYKKGLCSEAEKLYEEIITLPLYPGMSEDDVIYVIESLAKVIA